MLRTIGGMLVIADRLEPELPAEAVNHHLIVEAPRSAAPIAIFDAIQEPQAVERAFVDKVRQGAEDKAPASRPPNPAATGLINRMSWPSTGARQLPSPTASISCGLPPMARKTWSPRVGGAGVVADPCQAGLRWAKLAGPGTLLSTYQRGTVQPAPAAPTRPPPTWTTATGMGNPARDGGRSSGTEAATCPVAPTVPPNPVSLARPPW